MVTPSTPERIARRPEGKGCTSKRGERAGGPSSPFSLALRDSPISIKKYWQAIRSLARHLQLRGYLNGAEVREIVGLIPAYR
jgi:hypothetical protein